MQREAKATHRGVLHQLHALWAKGMTGEAVQAPILSLNDRCSLGEMTVTAFGRERVIALNPYRFRPRHDVKVPTFSNRQRRRRRRQAAGRDALGDSHRQVAWRFQCPTQSPLRPAGSFVIHDSLHGTQRSGFIRRMRYRPRQVRLIHGNNEAKRELRFKIVGFGR